MKCMKILGSQKSPCNTNAEMLLNLYFVILIGRIQPYPTHRTAFREDSKVANVSSNAQAAQYFLRPGAHLRNIRDRSIIKRLAWGKFVDRVGEAFWS